MEQRATTIRFPAELLESARKYKQPRESLNDLVVSAVQLELRRRQGLQAHAEIMRLRDQIEARTGVQPSSVPLIRQLREGNGRRD